MAELQTISAVYEIAQLTRKVILFLQRIKNADKVVVEVLDKVVRLRQVLKGVESVLEEREDQGIASKDDNDLQAQKRIEDCTRGCSLLLNDLRARVDGFDQGKSNLALPNVIEAVKIAFGHPRILRIQTDLEARINSLQTELSLLQLYDHAHTHAAIGSNHHEVLERLEALGDRLAQGNKVLAHLITEQNSPEHVENQIGNPRPRSRIIRHAHDQGDAIESLAHGLRIAENVHDKYTSEYQPDDRSVRFQRRTWSQTDITSPLHMTTPSSESSEKVSASLECSCVRSENLISPQNDYEEDLDDDNTGIMPPTELLNHHIEAYIERSTKELEWGHPNQAEINLQSAIQWSQKRERHYGIPFDNRHEMLEELALLYQKQGKWAEAVSKIAGLLREAEDESAQARQNQLLALIYHDRHLHQTGSLSHSTRDIENAERHAMKAFNTRYAMRTLSTFSEHEMEQHSQCIQLLVRILEAQDKTLEANGFATLLADDSALSSGSIRHMSPTSSSQPLQDNFVVVDKNDLLIRAIKSNDSEQLHNLLLEDEIDVERLCREGKTALIHAVEKSDEGATHRLLDPEVGADVNGRDKRGLTALHRAAELDLHAMVLCLISHDADIEAKDEGGETPVAKAVQKNQQTIVEILHDRGANMQMKDSDGWCLLHYAVRQNGIAMVNLVLDLAPDLQHAVDQAGKTALHHCADLAYTEHAAALLTHKSHVDVNATDSVSRSPLHLAASKPSTPRRESMVRVLLDHGAQLDESRLPPKYRDYAALKPFVVPRKVVKRHESFSPERSVGTVYSSATKLSRTFSGHMQFR